MSALETEIPSAVGTPVTCVPSSGEEGLVPRFAFLPALVLTASTLLAACSDSTGPSSISGTFILVSANGSPPPAFIASSGGCDQLIQAGFLHMNTDRTFTIGGTIRLDCSASGGSIQDQVLSLFGNYELSGQHLDFTIPGMSSLPARLSGDSLTATIPASPFTFAADAALVFLRVLTP